MQEAKISESDFSENNKRIAKNTLMLYIRILLMMGVSLYTVRIVLDALGPVDYGLYNVVGGVVIMFSFFSATMSAASQRFFAFELGRKNYKQLKNIFGMTMSIYFVIAVFVLILAETVGLWFFNNKLNIPLDRIDAAYWVYQFSILSFIMTMLSIPYNAALVAHEKMRVYAYFSIVEVILKLVIVYLLFFFSYDKLKLYSGLMFGVATLKTLMYGIYTQRRFDECRYSYYWDKVLFNEIIGFSGWNLFGALAGILNSQGLNILLNIFFGPVVNAARGIAFQVNNAINQFVQSFMMASTPQITKYYSTGERRQMLKLVFQSSKFSFLLLFVLSMPVLLETDFIFSLWLKETPEYLVLFTRLVIIGALIDSFSFSLTASAQATGRIKYFLIIVGGLKLLILPISYVFLKFGYSAETVFIISIINSVICLFFRIFLLEKMIGLDVWDYVRSVLLPLFLVCVVSYFFAYLLRLYVGFLSPFFYIVFGVMFSLLVIYLIGLSKEEKIYIVGILNKIKK